uniref:Metalloendopeptidase n=1 Tax=Anopheles dirus TaxID=7168 RepID=A0A182N604_9DIPT
MTLWLKMSFKRTTGGLTLLYHTSSMEHTFSNLVFILDQIERSNILDAMELLSKSTCLQFKERTTEKRHLIITDKLGNGCWADTGRQARGRTYMNLSRRCTLNRATILHELMHILGFLHQHARPDRGLYLCVLYENILPQPTALYNYAAIRPWTELPFPLPYDFESIMHYKPDMYSVAPGRLPTMIARRPWSAVTIGQREQLTVYDVLGIHFLYCLIPIDLSFFGTTLYRVIDTSVDSLIRNHDPTTDVELWELGNLIGGDMRLPRPRFQNALAGPLDAAYRWPNATVVYSIDGSFNSSELEFINGAMREFERHTCVRFRRRNTIGPAMDVAYVSIDNSDAGCWGDVGRGVERTVVNLQPGCANSLTTPVHELMHSLGFFHEHNRLDRDRYVTILYGNMLSDDSLQSNFDLVDAGNTTTFNVPYDLGSIMHYRRDAFSKRPKVLDTMQAKVPWEGELGQGTTLTWYDALLINIMYCGVPVPREPLPVPSRWIPAKAYGRKDRFLYERTMRNKASG